MEGIGVLQLVDVKQKVKRLPEWLGVAKQVLSILFVSLLLTFTKLLAVLRVQSTTLLSMYVHNRCNFPVLQHW